MFLTDLEHISEGVHESSTLRLSHHCETVVDDHRSESNCEEGKAEEEPRCSFGAVDAYLMLPFYIR